MSQRVIPIRFNLGTDDQLYEHLEKFKGKHGGPSSEAKRLMQDGLKFRQLVAEQLESEGGAHLAADRIMEGTPGRYPAARQGERRS